MNRHLFAQIAVFVCLIFLNGTVVLSSDNTRDFNLVALSTRKDYNRTADDGEYCPNKRLYFQGSLRSLIQQGEIYNALNPPHVQCHHESESDLKSGSAFVVRFEHTFESLRDLPQCAAAAATKDSSTEDPPYFMYGISRGWCIQLGYDILAPWFCRRQYTIEDNDASGSYTEQRTFFSEGTYSPWIVETSNFIGGEVWSTVVDNKGNMGYEVTRDTAMGNWTCIHTVVSIELKQDFLIK